MKIDNLITLHKWTLNRRWETTSAHINWLLMELRLSAQMKEIDDHPPPTHGWACIAKYTRKFHAHGHLNGSMGHGPWNRWDLTSHNPISKDLRKDYVQTLQSKVHGCTYAMVPSLPLNTMWVQGTYLQLHLQFPRFASFFFFFLICGVQCNSN